jgi:hypothetical protein
MPNAVLYSARGVAHEDVPRGVTKTVEVSMKRTPFSIPFALLLSLCLVFVAVPDAQAQADREAKIQNAMSAAPPSIAEQATIRDWPAEEDGEMPVLREGSSAWTCLPDMPNTPGNDPMCLDEPWLKWADAWMSKTEPNITQMGFGYMLQDNDSPYSNTDPYATGPTPDNEWKPTDVPHLMILVPDDETLEGLPTDPDGGPWVMWRGTPYVHIMAPMPKYTPELTMSQR